MDGGKVIFYDKLIENSTLEPGDMVNIPVKDEQGRKTCTIWVEILEVYKHHVLLDFGKYKECRRIADILLGLVTY